MSYRSLITALPCHTLEDFPTHHTGDEAEGILAAWCLPWHPALISDAGRAPVWRYLHAWDDAFRESLIVVPDIARSGLTDDWQSRSVAQQTRMLVGRTDLAGMTEEALQSIPPEHYAKLNPALVADFQALGYWYLQVQLLTRKMRYSSRLDEQKFQEQLLQAALAATAGDDPRAEEHLRCAFAVLAEERDHYYPVEAFLLDLLLVAPTTCGPALLAELQSDSPLNIMLTGATLRHMADVNPEALQHIRCGVTEGRITIVGGDEGELPLPLLPCETLLQELRCGQQTVEHYLGKRPVIYGRRRFGMSPLMPQLLKRLGYRGVFHATLDEGRFPESTQARTQWQGADGATIDALCSIPLDASRPETFLKFAVRMGESMELDYVATVCVAHWPGGSSPWLDLLRRGARYGLALGRFSTAEQFFEHTSYTGHTEQYAADRYRSPYLRQAVAQGQSNVISRHAQWWRRQVEQQAVRNLQCWNSILSGPSHASAANSLPLDDPTSSGASPHHEPLTTNAQPPGPSWSTALSSLMATIGAASSGATGTVVMTPWSAPCRTPCEVPAGVSANHPSGPIFAVSETFKQPHAVIDVPAAGFTWFADRNDPVKSVRSRLRRPKPVAENGVLQNEFMEVHIDPATGGIRAIFDYQHRGNRLSQQLVFAPPLAQANDRPDLRHTTMRARSVSSSSADMAFGEVTTEGELVGPDNQPVATFCQSFRLWRGSRVLRLSIEIQPQKLPGPTPWKSYYANRLAWADEANTLHRDLHGLRQAAVNRQFEAPTYVDIDGTTQHTYLIAGGLAYHQRIGNRMLDTLLIVHGESARKFELGIGIDLRQPLVDAYVAMVPLAAVRSTMPRAASGWLFHVDARHVVATGWEPLPATDGGTVSGGFRVRLMEVEGRAASVTLQAVRPIRSARRVDFLGQADGACTTDKGACRVELAPFEWTAVEARW